MRNFKVYYFFELSLCMLPKMLEHEYVTGNPRDRSLFGVGTV